MKFLIIIIFFLTACSSTKNDFKRCNTELIPYYSLNLKTKLDFYEIKSYFLNNFKKVESKQNTGIVKIRFDINCNGETGNFKVSTFDLEFKEAKIDVQITNQLLKLTKKLLWEPPINNDKEAVNCFKFYAFKIEKGVIIDVLPK